MRLLISTATGQCVEHETPPDLLEPGISGDYKESSFQDMYFLFRKDPVFQGAKLLRYRWEDLRESSEKSTLYTEVVFLCVFI